MAAYNWGMIENGGAFESLIHALLFAEDPGTLLFSRQGKDASQDARSEDGKTVYQAKFRREGSDEGPKELALAELEKISRYREEAHENYRHWRQAERWILYTNVDVNPNDHIRWKEAVIPLFAKIGLKAELWSKERIEGLLLEHPEVADVFLHGKNRAFLGLREACDHLKNLSQGEFFQVQNLLGRENEMERIRSFATSGNELMLRITGPAGTGKTRLAIEALTEFGKADWRVLWGLAMTMADSSEWFRLLNSRQKTVFVVDSPPSPKLLERILEQLSPTERREWRCIVAYRTEYDQTFRRAFPNDVLCPELRLRNLEESAAKAMLKAIMVDRIDDSRAHQVFNFTGGNPSWLALVGSELKRRMIQSLPASIDVLASQHVASCIEAVGDHGMREVTSVLRWLSLWGSMDLDAKESAEEGYLKGIGIGIEELRDILRQLVKTGLVINLGINKRRYEVAPEVIRDHILSEWLLREENGQFLESLDGRKMVLDLVAGKIPREDSVLSTITRLVVFRMDHARRSSLLEPILQVMAEQAISGSLLDQYRILDLVMKAGTGDPEGALAVLKAIRTANKKDVQIEAGLWGQQTLLHSGLLIKIPWLLFQLAEEVTDRSTAYRYLLELLEYASLERTEGFRFDRGQEPSVLLNRLLCDSKASTNFFAPACELAQGWIGMKEKWPFARLLLESLLDPNRRHTDFVGKSTLRFHSGAIRAGGDEWNPGISLRKSLFGILRESTNHSLRCEIWDMLADSHHKYLGATCNLRDGGGDRASYEGLLEDDIRTCAEILSAPPVALGISEATHARGIWARYLECERDQQLSATARECEQVFARIMPFDFPSLFRFGSRETSAKEVAKAADLLRTAKSTDEISDFFAAATEYVDNAARDWRTGHFQAIEWIADECSADFAPDAHTRNAITEFALSTLAGTSPEVLDWQFSSQLVRRFLLNTKHTLGPAAAVEALRRLLAATRQWKELVVCLYTEVFPSAIGGVTNDELDLVLSVRDEFQPGVWCSLLGSFFFVNPAVVTEGVQGRSASLDKDDPRASECMVGFLRSLQCASLRQKEIVDNRTIEWIFKMMADFRMTGAILNSYEMWWIRDQMVERLPMLSLVHFLESRICLEENPSTALSVYTIPLDFKLQSWWRFDESSESDQKHFETICNLALKDCYFSYREMPQFLAELDPSGELVARFVRTKLPGCSPQELARLARLAAGYPVDSSGWAAISTEICRAANMLPPDDKKKVHIALLQQETGVISSTLGEVADHYYRAVDLAKELLKKEEPGSPLHKCRELALHIAEEELRREIGEAEEDARE